MTSITVSTSVVIFSIYCDAKHHTGEPPVWTQNFFVAIVIVELIFLSDCRCQKTKSPSIPKFTGLVLFYWKISLLFLKIVYCQLPNTFPAVLMNISSSYSCRQYKRHFINVSWAYSYYILKYSRAYLPDVKTFFQTFV